MMPLESSVERKVKKWADGRGILTTKLPIGGGWPDRAFWFDGGRVALVEFKRFGGEPTELQFYRLEQLRSLGYMVFWTDEADAAIEFLKKFL
jgi:hypothetical protein